MKKLKFILLWPVSVSKTHWVDANVYIFLPFNARELKFCVYYLRGKSAPLANFQHNWTRRSKVSIFSLFICIMSSPIVSPPLSSPQTPQKRRRNTIKKNFLTKQARELKFCVYYLREKSAPLTNFQPNWTTTSKVSDFGHFIRRMSSPIVPPHPPTLRRLFLPSGRLTAAASAHARPSSCSYTAAPGSVTTSRRVRAGTASHRIVGVIGLEE